MTEPKTEERKCTNCGGPFHGITPCPSTLDSPKPMLRRPAPGTRIRIVGLNYKNATFFRKEGIVLRHADLGRGIYVRVVGATDDVYISEGWEVLPPEVIP